MNDEWSADQLTEEIGTVRWFGDGWGAPVNDPRARVPVPVGEPCMGGCGHSIAEHDRGIGIPHLPGGHYGWHHLGCWLRSLGLTPDILRSDDSLYDVAKEITEQEFGVGSWHDPRRP